MENNNSSKLSETLLLIGGIITAIAVIFGVLAALYFGFQWMKVYSREQTGKAQLAEARFSKQVQLEQAKSNLEAQKLNAQAEVERARGAAQAIDIENGKLTDRYIRYLYVQNLENLDTSLIYVPTEGGLPLLEAGRLNQQAE